MRGNKCVSSHCQTSGITKYIAYYTLDYVTLLSLFILKCDLLFSSLSLLSQQNLVRKASCAVFSQAGDLVLVGDKSGDLYSLRLEGGAPPSLLAGHLSQLLDLALSHHGDLVLTADRDEKIRVSRFPRAYNIETFCLGHTEFVTCLCLAEEKDQILSGSGDGTVRLWNYREGVELCRLEVTEQVGLSAGDSENTEPERNGVVRVSPPSEPALVKMRRSRDMLVVQVENFKNLLIYKLTGETIKFRCQLELQSCLLDFDSCGAELSVLRKTENSAVLESYQLDQENIIKNKTLAFQDQEKFFLSIQNFEDDGLKNLHKRWFDNMKEYLERKEARIEKAKSKSSTQPPVPVPVKKQKCET